MEVVFEILVEGVGHIVTELVAAALEVATSNKKDIGA